ncbi:RING-H2 finger protein ATL73-like [Panicum virgatum]|uniref:RING-H2 finger protein ATL73-like n=1 Tax=Panicum virgatum TaxID=38727 RepID=UPI0019D62A52|nr:RING-H2 finger protein ATL73-like [Panicum virgatum]
MEVELSQAQSPMRVIVLAPGEPNPFSVADDPDVTPAWVSMGLSKRARVAAASEAILPEVSGRSREGEECAICLQDFAAEETLGAMPCSHAFHRHCISKWLCRSAASYPPLPSPRSTATTRWWNG